MEDEASHTSVRCSLLIIADPFAAQWGYLSWLFRNAVALRGQMQLPVLTGQAWEIRNELAHYRPVQFAQFRRL